MRKPSSFAALREDRRRGGKIGRSAYKFVAVVGISLVLAVCLHFGLLGAHSGADAWNQRRDLATLATDDDTCRMVHSAPDQCKWIKKHCPQDDGAYSAYLDLYFCQLPRLKPLVFILLASWLGLLFSTIGIAASDFFCVDLSTMAKILGMSESMAGVTLLAFGNGSPDVFSTFAAMSSDSGDLAVGELMGAAGFITAVVAGAMAIIRPFKVSKKSFVRDVVFFAVAAAFTMVILSDGILHLWECLAMIGYYVFYVIFVITWHWFESRRKRKLDTEAAARGHYAPVLPGEEPYRDDPDDTSIRPSTLRAPSHDDFAALERSTVDDDGDYSDEERDRWMSELNTNMRVSRPLTRPRSTTIAPVRPSLVGALEFQAVLKSLQKSRNQQPVLLNTRRYSDDPNLRAFDIPPRQARRVSIGPGSPDADRSPLGLLIPPLSVGGPQAYTATEAPRKTLDDELQWRGHGYPPHHVSFQPPTIEVSVSSPEQGPADRPSDLSALRAHPVGSKSDNLLNHRKLLNRLNSPTLSPREPTLAHHVLLPIPPRSRSRSSTRSHTPPSPFPAYRDESLSRIDHLALPPPIVEPEPDTLTLIHGSEYESQFAKSRQWSWWPYSILPSPESMAGVLFPTLTDFRAKGIWAKTLSVIAAPSVFLLTITLPVVESDSPEEELVASRSASVFQEPPKKPTDPVASQEQTDGETAAVMTAVEQHLLNKRPDSVSSPSNVDSIDDMQARLMQQSAIHEAWPRWLLLIQLYTAPWTVLLSAWSQAPETLPPSWLIKPGLIALLISTLSLIVVLLTTTSSYRPRQYRWILALVGFAVSIAWISTIANQVVDALKALAVILNWSNAIMGLTVFAVGNSVGDLVADVTVANLGYPVMALSACFGGPMLNILLGIGLSGTYTILQGADKRSHKHPKKGFVIKDYHLDVGKTLIISGAALLVTLIGVLIAVPLSKWTMTRKIGIALIVVWLLSTIGNVVVEVTGIADVKRYP